MCKKQFRDDFWRFAMPLVPAKCTQCGASLEIDSDQEAAVCSYCHQAFIVEKAITNYVISNATINTETVNVSFQRDFIIEAGELKRYIGAGIDVVVPDGVVVIGGYEEEIGFQRKYHGAFDGMSNIRSITLPDGLEKIGDMAFVGCGISRINIPESVSYIGRRAFAETKLEEVAIPEGCELYNPFGQFIRECPDGGIFRNCKSLSKVTLPSSLREIPDLTFTGCYALSAIELKDGLISIGNRAFSGTSLQEITIPDTVTNICTNNCFGGCISLKKINASPQIMTQIVDSHTACEIPALIEPRRQRGLCPVCGHKLSLFGKCKRYKSHVGR
jgi:DNA-directed RNA polymerase subunit RPC12/RpoP